MGMSAATRKKLSESKKAYHERRRTALRMVDKGENESSMVGVGQPTFDEPPIPAGQLPGLSGDDISLLVDVLTKATQRQIEFIQSEMDVQEAKHMMEIKLRLLQIAHTF